MRGRRSGSTLPVERARSRFSAAVYGNILVLGAIVAQEPGAEGSTWGDVAIVVGTALSTFLAHVVAHAIGDRIGREEDDLRAHGRAALRDAVPILSSGTGPAVILALGALDVIAPPWPLVLAGLVVTLRLAGSGILAQQTSGVRSRRAILWSGLGLAALALVVVGLKVVLTH